MISIVVDSRIRLSQDLLWARRVFTTLELFHKGYREGVTNAIESVRSHDNHVLNMALAYCLF